MTMHWYDLDGNPCHWQKKKDGSGNRPTTVYDARFKNLLPSPTGVISRVLAAPALTEYKVRQGILACMTAPRRAGEELDAFITRIIDEERQHEQESAIAKDRGKEIHAAIKAALKLIPIEEIEKPSPPPPWPSALDEFVFPVCDAILKSGRVISTEKIIVNKEDGYAGTLDCLTENDECITTWDFKTSKTLPKKDAYDEHKMQVSAYAKALGNTGNKRVECNVCYISKNEPGQIKVCRVEDWPREFQKFKLLLHFFYLQNDLGLPQSFAKPLPF